MVSRQSFSMKRPFFKSIKISRFPLRKSHPIPIQNYPSIKKSISSPYQSFVRHYHNIKNQNYSSINNHNRHVTDLFKKNNDEIIALFLDADRVKYSAFFGDCLLKSYISHLLWKQQSSKHLNTQNTLYTIGEMTNYRSKYENNKSMALYLCGSTNILTIIPELSSRNVHSIGTMFEALVWEYVPEEKREINNFTFLLPLLDDYMQWVDLNVLNDVWQNKNQISQNNFNQTTNENNIASSSQNFNMLSRGAQLQVLENTSTRKIEEITNIHSMDDDVVDYNKLMETINKVKARDSALLQHSLDSSQYEGIIFDNQGEGHVWEPAIPVSQNKDVYDNLTLATWRGQQCTSCRAMLVNRKISNKNSSKFLLGLEQCPGKTMGWLQTYKESLLYKSTNNQLGWISPAELKAWGFFSDDEKPTQVCPKCQSSMDLNTTVVCSNKFPCKLYQCSNRYPCKRTTKVFSCDVCNHLDYKIVNITDQ